MGAAGGVKDKGQLHRPDPGSRYCEVDAASANGVCTGVAPPGFSACIAHAGSESCPSGIPFHDRTVVSDDVTLACSPCSACGIAGTCTSATIALFTGENCGSGILAVAADGTCAPTDAQNANVGSVLYNATLTEAGASCVPGTSIPTLVSSGAITTLCCR